MAQKTEPHDLNARMWVIEMTRPNATPEQEARCLDILRRRDALDIAPLLGLEVPA